MPKSNRKRTPRRHAPLTGWLARLSVHVDVPPPRLFDDARDAFTESQRSDNLLTVEHDSRRGPGGPGASAEAQVRFVVFARGDERILLSAARVPGGTYLSGRFISGRRPEAVYLRRPGHRIAVLRLLAHGAFESDLERCGPARLEIDAGPAGQGHGLLWTDWITI